MVGKKYNRIHKEDITMKIGISSLCMYEIIIFLNLLRPHQQQLALYHLAHTLVS